MIEFLQKYAKDICLGLALIVVYIVVQSGFVSAMSGNAPNIWIHFAAFAISIMLVILAILIPALLKIKKK